MPWTISSMTPSLRAIFLMTARVPTVCRSAKPGCSSPPLRWALTTNVFSSVASAASMAATLCGRPTDSGTNRPGNSTVLRSGSSGSDCFSAAGVASAGVASRATGAGPSFS
jgi:hypothetical protein